MKLPRKAIRDIEKETGTLYIYDYIGKKNYYAQEGADDSITDIDIINALKEMQQVGVKRVNVRINSPGGSIKHGDGIIAALQNCKMEVHGYVDGMAASMAADIFFSIKKGNRHIAANGKLMIHGPIGEAYGNSKQLRLVADMLEKFGEASAARMANDTGMKEEEIIEKYFDGNDHWVTAKEAVKIGFVNAVEDYEVESLVANPEKMTYEQIVKVFESTKTIENNIFKKLTAFFRKETPEKAIINHNDNDKEMKSIDDIIKACETGELNLIDLQERLAAVKAATTPAKIEINEQEETNSLAEIEKLLDAKLKPLQSENEALKAAIEKLSKAPVAEPTKMQHLDPEDEDEFDALKALNDTLRKAATSNEPIRVNGYGGAKRK